jgi:hypothetical protein
MIHQCSVLKRNQSRQSQTAAPEPQRLKTLANLQRAIASIFKPRLLQYRAVHHDSERIRRNAICVPISRPFIIVSGKRHNQKAIASHMRL